MICKTFLYIATLGIAMWSIGCATAPATSPSESPPADTGGVEIRVEDANCSLETRAESYRVTRFSLYGTTFRGEHALAVTQEQVAGWVRHDAGKTGEPLVVVFEVGNPKETVIDLAKAIYWLRQAVGKANVKNKVILVCLIDGVKNGRFMLPDPPARASEAIP